MGPVCMARLGYVPSLLCAEFVMGRVCHVPSLLCAELSLNPSRLVLPFPPCTVFSVSGPWNRISLIPWSLSLSGEWISWNWPEREVSIKSNVFFFFFFFFPRVGKCTSCSKPWSFIMSIKIFPSDWLNAAIKIVWPIDIFEVEVP